MSLTHFRDDERSKFSAPAPPWEQLSVPSGFKIWKVSDSILQ